MERPSERPDLVTAMIAIINREFSYIPELLPSLVEKFKDNLVHSSFGPFRVEVDWTIPQPDEEWPYPMILPRRIAQMKREMLYEFCKPGDSIIVDVPSWEWHGKVLRIEKKQNQQFTCIDPKEGGLVWRINASSAKLMIQEKKVAPVVKVGDLVTITHEFYRPRYEEDSLFVVVWKGAKYFRVVPRFPKYETFEKESYSTIKKPGKPGDNIFEREEPGSRSYWRKSVYNTDLPFGEVSHPTQYSEEDIDMVNDLGEVGF